MNSRAVAVRFRGFTGEEQRVIHGCSECVAGVDSVDRCVAISAAEARVAVPIMEIDGLRTGHFATQCVSERIERGRLNLGGRRG